MPTDTHRITGLTLDGQEIREASGSLVVATTEIDTTGDEHEEADLEARYSWRGTLVTPSPGEIYERLKEAEASGVHARFVLEGDVHADGHIALPPAYEHSEPGEVEFAGAGELRGVPLPDVERR